MKDLENMIQSHIYKNVIIDRETGKASNFLVLKKGDNNLWISELKEYELVEKFLGNNLLKVVFRDPKVANDTKGIPAQDGRGSQFKRDGKNVIVTTFLMTYGEQWRDEFRFEIEADLFDSHLQVAANKRIVDEVLAKERGPKALNNFGD